VKEVVEETVNETVKEVIHEAVKESVKEVVKEAVKEAVKEVVNETMKEVVKDSRSERRRVWSPKRVVDGILRVAQRKCRHRSIVYPQGLDVEACPDCLRCFPSSSARSSSNHKSSSSRKSWIAFRSVPIGWTKRESAIRANKDDASSLRRR